MRSKLSGEKWSRLAFMLWLSTGEVCDAVVGRCENGMKGSRILVIEDDLAGRELLGKLFERAGLEPVEASDGVEGLRVLYEQRPDLVVLDVGLPSLDGWRVLERIRELTDVPVLMLTGHASELERVR